MKKFLAGALALAGSVAAFEFLRRKGVVDQVSGKVKKVVGEVTENKEMEAEGVFQQSTGKAKEFASNVTEAVKENFED